MHLFTGCRPIDIKSMLALVLIDRQCVAIPPKCAIAHFFRVAAGGLFPGFHGGAGCGPLIVKGHLTRVDIAFINKCAIAHWQLFIFRALAGGLSPGFHDAAGRGPLIVKGVLTRVDIAVVP